ncbi:MAG: hypothetical protein ACKVVP_20025 [Chloroflexota bacterium]
MVTLLAVLTACSPEAQRRQGGGLGADPGNTQLPIQVHGNQQRSNPSFNVPPRGRVPADSRGVAGWWTRD